MNSFTLQLRELIEFAKVLKSDIVYISGNIIYGTDEGFTYLKQIEFINTLNVTMCYKQSDMNNFIKLATLDIEYSNNTLYSNIESVQVYNEVYIKSILRLYTAINEIIFNNIPKINVENVRDSNEFEQAIALKSSQGIGMYRVNEEYVLAIFKSLLPINKKDKVSLLITDVDNYRFLSRFTISKPKNINILVDILYLKIK